MRLVPAGAILLFFAFSCFSDQGWEGHSLHCTWENDAIRGADRHYTQGSKIGYLSSDEAVPDWLWRWSDHIPALGLKPEALKFGLDVGQDMYTPEDLDTADLIPNDRPYAGWLYGRALLQRRGTGLASIPVMESFAFELGVIGPESFAEDTQKVWHGRTDHKFGVYLFGRISGRLVLHNLFLDGNTWSSSHSVDKNFWVGDLSAGITFVLKSFELTASNNYRSREFHGQDRADSYGSATLTFKF